MNVEHGKGEVEKLRNQRQHQQAAQEARRAEKQKRLQTTTTGCTKFALEK